MKEIDRNRRGTKKRSRELMRDLKQYHLGYFSSKEESDEAYNNACALYEQNIDLFKERYKRYREVKSIKKEKIEFNQ